MSAPNRARKPVVVTLQGDNAHLSNLCGPLDANLRQIADGWNVQITRRGDRVSITGEQAKAAGKAIEVFHRRAAHQPLSIDDIQLGMVEMGTGLTDPGACGPAAATYARARRASASTSTTSCAMTSPSA
jgi:phosphate starvation-inducible PhoH-like protein